MQFCEGHLDAETARRLGERLASDAQLQRRYRRVRKAARAPSGRVSREPLPAELLAAYVEGTLAADESARVESACWRSAATLSEAVSVYRFLTASAPPQQPPAEMTRRLLALAPHGPDSHPAPPPAVNGAVPRPRAQTEFATRERRRRRPRPAWLAAAAALVVVFVIGSILALRGRDGAVDLVQPDPPAVAAPRPEGELVEFEPWDEPFRDLPEPRPDRRPDPDLVEPPPQTANADEPPRPGSEPPLDRTPYEPVAGGQPLNLEWGRIEGLLAVRDRASGTWKGAACEDAARQATDFATFPGSWAESLVGRLGRLILGDDTSVSVTADASSGQIDLELVRGRVALCDLAPGVDVRIKAGAARGSFAAQEADSTVAIAWDQDLPLLFLRSGAVLLDGQHLAAGREAVWVDGSFRLRDSDTHARWIEPPGRPVRWSDELRTRLLHSADLRTDLASARSAGPAGTRLLTTQWTLALFPDEIAFDSLRSDDQHIRLEALNWLVAPRQPPDVRQRLAWRSLAVSSGDPATVRRLYAWAQQIPGGARAITPTDAEQMVRLLTHQELAFRQAAIFFLEGFFGKRVRYDPTAPAAARHRAAQQWIRRLRGER